MRQYFETIIDAKTGEKTKRPYTAEETAAHEARFKPQKLAGLGAIRWQHQTKGLTFDGHTIQTDPASQSAVMANAMAASIDPDATFAWKTADGRFITLTAADMGAIARAVHAHVQACFAHEASLSASIEAATTVDDLEAIDITVGWPT